MNRRELSELKKNIKKDDSENVSNAETEGLPTKAERQEYSSPNFYLMCN